MPAAPTRVRFSKILDRILGWLARIFSTWATKYSVGILLAVVYYFRTRLPELLSSLLNGYIGDDGPSRASSHLLMIYPPPARAGDA
jgi:hypothetical protein